MPSAFPVAAPGAGDDGADREQMLTEKRHYTGPDCRFICLGGIDRYGEYGRLVAH